MRRTTTLAAALALGCGLAACGGDSNTNNANTNASRSNTNNANAAGRDGLIQTNANVPQNLNSKTAPPGTAVVTNDNGNKNTDGIRSINSNNANHNGASKGNGNH